MRQEWVKKQADVYRNKHRGHAGKKENGNRVKYMKYLLHSAMRKVDYNLRSKEMPCWKMNSLLHNSVT